MKLRHSILAACASTAIAAPASPADNNPLATRALTCVEMGGSYTSASTNTKFTVACKSTPVDSVPLSYIQALSFDACLDACAGLPACAAATYVSMFRNCNFYSSVGGGVRSNPGFDFAMKAAPEPEPRPTTSTTTTAEATTAEAQPATTTSAEPTTSEAFTSEAFTSEAATTSSQATSEVAASETSSESTPSSESVSESASSATVDSTGVTSSVEFTTITTTSDILSAATTSTRTSTDAETTAVAETSTISEVSSTSETTTVTETATTSDEATASGTTSLETSSPGTSTLDTTILETIVTSEASTAPETSALETSTIVTGSTTTEPGSSSTSQAATETDDCDESSTTEPALPTTTLEPSEPLTTSASMTQDIPSASESTSIASESESAVSSPCTTGTQVTTAVSESTSTASQPDFAVSSPCITETQATTATSELSHSQSTSTLTGASSSSAGPKTIADYALPDTATSQYGLPTSKVITVTEGGHVVTKTVPCDTPIRTKGYPDGHASSGSVNNHQTRTGHGVYGDAQPTTGSQGYLPPNHEDGGSGKHGSSSDNGGLYGNGGSYASIDNHQTGIGHNGHASAQPTAGSHTDVHSEYENTLPSGTGHNVHVEAQPTHGASQPVHKDGHSYVPVPTQGYHSKPQPGQENTQPDHEKAQPSAPIHGSPEDKNHGEPYPTQGAQPITVAPKPGNPSPVTQSHEAASTTLATKSIISSVVGAPKSTHSDDSSKAGEAPVAVSGANKYQVVAWTWMAAVMGLVFIQAT